MASLPSPSGIEIDEEDAWRRWRETGEPAARLALFDRHAPFAVTLARRTHRNRSRGDLDLTDLVQQAHGALLETIDRYDPARGVPFPAYASRRIIGSLTDAVARTSEVRAHSSARARTNRDRVRSLSGEAVSDTGQAAALESLADLAMELALGFMLEEGSATQTIGAPSSGFDAYRGATWRELLGRLADELEALPARERDLLKQHYLHGIAFDTLASLLTLSKGRISQLHRSALQTLRKRLAMRGHFSLER